MKVPRRRFLVLATGAAVLAAVSRSARAQAYPTRPVRIVVGAAAVGASDITARLVGQWLSERLGQQFIIDNRTGFVGNIGTEAVVRAPPDGYTLLLADLTAAINATLYDKLNFNFVRDIAPVASIMSLPLVVVVHPSFPAKSVPEFIAYTEANPGKINYGSGGVGSALHMTVELFKMMTGVNMGPVQYRGEAPALTDLLGGHVHVVFASTAGASEYVKAGKLRPLAVTTATRWAALPEVPTVGEFVPGYEASFWAGIGSPRNTPFDIIDKLNHDINLAIADPKMKARIADLGGTGLAGSPDEFGKFIAKDREKWAKVIQAANIKVE
jgi:tripartite-type tricarboxylate transporter receptor subunit TctC